MRGAGGGTGMAGRTWRWLGQMRAVTTHAETQGQDLVAHASPIISPLIYCMRLVKRSSGGCKVIGNVAHFDFRWPAVTGVRGETFLDDWSLQQISKMSDLIQIPKDANQVTDADEEV